MEPNDNAPETFAGSASELNVEEAAVDAASDSSEVDTDQLSSAPSGDESVPHAVDESTNDVSDEEAKPEFDALRALTNLFLGGAIEGTSQLVTRLEAFEDELRRQAAEQNLDSETSAAEEDEVVRLRYAFVGFVLDAQDTFRRNFKLWARLVDNSARVTGRVARPISNKLIVGPFQRRYDRLVRRGESSFSRWVDTGRSAEPHGRELARMTYTRIIDEFINQLAENPEVQGLVAQQSIGLAGEARDEVRERTVTADNLMEGIVRKILRRTPRSELPEPPPEVQKWANLTLDEYKIETKRPEDRDSS